MIKEMFAGIIPVLERSLDIRTLRHNVIASNIANEETPGYKAKDINFQKELDKSVSAGGIQLYNTQNNHFSGKNPSNGIEVIARQENAAGLDNNSVSLEGEMVKMAENTMMYNADMTILAKRFRSLREAIKEGR